MSGSSTSERLVTASASDVGRAPSENQDACAEFRNDRSERLLVVADGRGGPGGATAARLCIEAMGRAFNVGEGLPDERLRAGMDGANRAIRYAALQTPELTGMGATAIALLFQAEGPAWLAWIGDSRAYRFRSGRLQLLSRDHSVVAEWVRLGVISAEEAESHPRRNELLRALGASEDVEAEVRRVEVLPGDRFLLCSAGLCGVVPEAVIAAALGFDDPQAAVRRLIARANDDYGGPDNATVQIADVPPAEPLSAGETLAAGIDWQQLRPRARPSRRPLVLGAVAVLGLAGLGAALWALSPGTGRLRPGAGDDVATPLTPDAALVADVARQIPSAEERRRITEVRRTLEGDARRLRREAANEEPEIEETVIAAPPIAEFGAPAPAFGIEPTAESRPRPEAETGTTPEPEPERIAAVPPAPVRVESPAPPPPTRAAPAPVRVESPAPPPPTRAAPAPVRVESPAPPPPTRAAPAPVRVESPAPPPPTRAAPAPVRVESPAPPPGKPAPVVATAPRPTSPPEPTPLVPRRPMPAPVAATSPPPPPPPEPEPEADPEPEPGMETVARAEAPAPLPDALPEPDAAAGPPPELRPARAAEPDASAEASPDASPDAALPQVAAGSGVLSWQTDVPEAPIAGQMDAFFQAWAEAVRARDFAAYRRLGLPQDEDDFREAYGEAEGVEIRFVLLDHRWWGGAFHDVRVEKRVAYKDGADVRQTRTEERLSLRQTPEGFRFED